MRSPRIALLFAAYFAFHAGHAIHRTNSSSFYTDTATNSPLWDWRLVIAAIFWAGLVLIARYVMRERHLAITGAVLLFLGSLTQFGLAESWPNLRFFGLSLTRICAVAGFFSLIVQRFAAKSLSSVIAHIALLWLVGEIAAFVGTIGSHFLAFSDFSGIVIPASVCTVAAVSIGMLLTYRTPAYKFPHVKAEAATLPETHALDAHLLGRAENCSSPTHGTHWRKLAFACGLVVLLSLLTTNLHWERLQVLQIDFSSYVWAIMPFLMSIAIGLWLKNSRNVNHPRQLLLLMLVCVCVGATCNLLATYVNPQLNLGGIVAYHAVLPAITWLGAALAGTALHPRAAAVGVLLALASREMLASIATNSLSDFMPDIATLLIGLLLIGLVIALRRSPYKTVLE